MKKQYIYSIIFVLLLTIAIIGSTYAFFAASDASKSVTTGSSKFEVLYTGGTHINGPMFLGKSKEDGLHTSVNIKVSPDSVNAKGIIYLTINEMSPLLSSDGFIWEVYRTKNGQTTYQSSGNFLGKNNTNNNTIELVQDYLIDKENTTFTIYFWLDGNKFDNSIDNASFDGDIGAKTEDFTGAIS